jgi:glycosyltransferase involved in cell wall biosynthesis
MKPLSSETTQELTGKLVSVIMPAFNVEAYLRCAVNSVLNQTYQPHEILFIDDGSTDDTARVAQEFGDCIRYIYQKNAGVSAARNRGIQEVSGDFIAFLDADDEWLPNHLERAMKVFKRYPFLKWFAAAHEERSHEMEVVKPKISQKVKDMLGTKEYFDDYFHANNIGKVFWTGTFVMRKSVFDKVGIFDKNLRRGGIWISGFG